MQIETTREADVQCKDLIGESYEASYAQAPNGGWFSGLPVVWGKIQETLKFDLCTTVAEDTRAMDLLVEVFGEACRTAMEERFPADASEYVDYKALWEKLMAVIGVST